MKKVSRLSILLLISMALIFSCATRPPTLLSYYELGVATFFQDNQTIAVFLSSGSSSNLYKIKVDGTGLKKLGENLPLGYDHAFSPDGTLVAFSQVSNGQGDICVMKTNGADRTFLTSGPEHDFQPVFSPDGRKIYFIRALALKIILQLHGQAGT